MSVDASPKKPRGKQRGPFTVSMSNMSPRQDASVRVRKDSIVIALVRSAKHSNLISWMRNNPMSNETKSLREQLEARGYGLKELDEILS